MADILMMPGVEKHEVAGDEPVASVVACLEGLLLDAKAGKIREIAIAINRLDFVGTLWEPADRCSHDLASAIEDLSWKFHFTRFRASMPTPINPGEKSE